MSEKKTKMFIIFIALCVGLITGLWPEISVSKPDRKKHAARTRGSIELNLQAGQPEYSRTGDNNDSVQLKGFSWLQSPGDPQLPSKIYNVLLPPGADISSVNVSITKSSSREVEKDFDIRACKPYALQQQKKWRDKRGKAKPREHEEHIWGKGKKIINGRNLLVYKHNRKYPRTPVELLSTGVHGQLKYVRLRFTPFQYKPITKKLTLNSEVKCRISFETGEKINVSSNTLKSLRVGIASELYTNSKDALGWYSPEPAESSGEPAVNAGTDTGYLIVTTNAINGSGALDDFITHKEGEGWTVTTLTETLPTTGYGSATGQDRSDNIRTWLQANYVGYNLKYVLLVGDPRIDSSGVPMKKTYAQGKNYNPSDWPKYVPTDYYYADLTGNWDLDGDGYYGEYDDDNGPGGVDFMVEVYVGRIPVYPEISGWETTLTSIMDKIVSYQTASVLERRWRRSILLPESFSDSDTDGAYLGQEMVEGYLGNNSFSYYRMYQQGNYDSGYDALVDSNFDVSTDCEQEMLAGNTSYSDSMISHWANATSGYGLVQWWGHGNQKGAYAGFTGHQDPRNSGAFMYSDWLSAALDDSKPAFTMQISCTNADPAATDNLAYSLLMHGAIATLAGTNVTYYWVGQQDFNGTASNAGMGYEYIERLVADNPCGEAYYDAIAGLDSASSHNWWNFTGFNVYGDPSCAPNYAPLLDITTESLENCEVGASYSAFLEADYGTEPYSWSLASGSSLPPGLSLVAGTGEIYGTPSQAGTFYFTIEVSDSATEQGMDDKLFSLQVLNEDPALPVPVLTGDVLSTTSIEWSWGELAGDFDSYILHSGDHSIVHTIATGTTQLVENAFGPNTPVTRHMHTIGSTSSVIFSDNFSSSSGWSLGQGGEVQDQTNTGTSSYGYFVDSEQYTAQSFAAGMDGTLIKVDVFVYKYPAAQNDLVVEIRPNVLDGSDNVPGNTPLGSCTIPRTQIPGGGWQTVSATFDISSVNSGTRYWIVLKCSDDHGEGYLWRRGNDLYSSGNPASSEGSSTGPWELISDYDAYFTTYMEGAGWEIDSAQAGGSSEGGNPDPASDHTDTGDNKILGYVLGGDYTDNLSERVAISPEVDLSGYTQATLSFWRWLNVEKGIYDHAYIRVSPDGGSSWTQYWTNPSDVDLTDSSWQEIEIPITATAADRENVQIAFVMGSTNAGLHFSGWNIDDIELVGIVDKLSASSNVVTVYTLAAVPGAIALSDIDYGSIRIDWTANGNPEGTCYEIERSVTGGGEDFETVYTGAGLTFTDTWLEQNTTYYYRLRALNGDDVATAYTDESQATTPAWSELEEVPTSTGAINPYKARVAVDSAGTVHSVWQQTDNGSTGLKNIYYSYLTEGGSWSTAVIVSTSNPGGDYGAVDHPHIAIDSSNDLHVVWGGYGTNNAWQIWYRKLESGTWLDPVEVTTGTDDSYWPDIAVSSTGRVYIVFVTYLSASSAEEIYCSYSDNGTTWITPVSVSESPTLCSWGPSIDMDGSNVLHVVWSEEMLSLWSHDVFYRNFNGTSWSTAVNLSNNTSLSRAPDIVVGGSGTIMVVWDNNYHTPAYCYYNGTSWGASSVICDDLPDSGMNMSIAYHSGVFHAGWIQRTGRTPDIFEIWYASFDATLSWNTPVSLSDDDGSCEFGSTGGGIAVDGNGDLHVVFNERAAGKLWYTNNK